MIAYKFHANLIAISIICIQLSNLPNSVSPLILPLDGSGESSSPSSSPSSSSSSSPAPLNLPDSVSSSSMQSNHHMNKRGLISDKSTVNNIKVVAGESLTIHCLMNVNSASLVITVENESQPSTGDPVKVDRTTYTFVEEIYWFKGECARRQLFGRVTCRWFHSSLFSLLLFATDVKRLPMNKRQEIYENGTLILRDLVKPDDAGVYTCSSASTLSSASESTSDAIRSDLVSASIQITVLRK